MSRRNSFNGEQINETTSLIDPNNTSKLSSVTLFNAKAQLRDDEHLAKIMRALKDNPKKEVREWYSEVGLISLTLENAKSAEHFYKTKLEIPSYLSMAERIQKILSDPNHYAYDYYNDINAVIRQLNTLYHTDYVPTSTPCCTMM